MIKANELRIGNYVDINSTNEEISLWHLLKIAECSIFEDEITPITLTDEWLIKFGFEKLLNQYKIQTKSSPFIILFLDEEFEYDDLRFRTILKHVHQLQNLYFALTGEELTIK